MYSLCLALREKHSIGLLQLPDFLLFHIAPHWGLITGVVTNDIFTKEDGEFLIRNSALPKERILAVETGLWHKPFSSPGIEEWNKVTKIPIHHFF